jgi:DNA-binding transcriptional LysR family regulator
MTIRIDDIDYFLAVAEHGKVRAAAMAIGVSQPAVSQGLRRLENELGFPLFERSGSGMRPTAVARKFHMRIQALRSGLDAAVQEAADAHLGELGVLRVGVSPLYLQRLFVPAAAELRRQRPAASLRVMLHLNEELLAALRQGSIDLAISALPAEMPDDLEAISLVEDALCLVVREGHPLLMNRRLRLQELAGAQWMLPGPGVAVRRSIDQRLARAGLPLPHVVVEVSNTALGQLNGLAVQSDLIAVMSESLIGTPWGHGLVPLPMADARFSRSVGAITRKSALLPQLASRFLDLLKAVDQGPKSPSGVR